MNLNKDPWDILGVSRSASEDEVKRAYKKLVAKYHPDRNKDDPSAEERIKEVNTAYAIMSDPTKFQAYLNEKNGYRGHTGGSWYDPEVNPFQYRPQQRAPKKRTKMGGADIHVTQEITLEQLFHGAVIPVSYWKRVLCTTCNGTGTKSKQNPHTCHVCQGHGTIIKQQGPWMVEDVCPVCHGSGESNDDPCPDCRGQRFTSQHKTLNITIPAGLKLVNGSPIVERQRVRGGGNDGEPGTFTGNLIISLQIKPHPVFELKGADVWASLEINSLEAILGCEKTIKTIEGEIRVKVGAGVDTGSILKIPQRGMKIRTAGNETQRGDAYYTIKVKTLKPITDEQKSLLEQALALVE